MRHLQVDSATAECGHPGDTEQIRGRIHTEGGSFALLNSVVFDWRKAMVQFLLQVAPPPPPQANATEVQAFFRYHVDDLQVILHAV